MKKIAIVGFGCAGYSAAKAIRQTNMDVSIDVFEAGGEAPANPMLTTYYASGKIKKEGAYPFGNLEKIVKELNVTFHSQSKVIHVDALEKKLILENGERKVYDKILISTGAHAFLPPLPGLPDERVFLMRTMEDAEKVKARVASGAVKKAVVVGASMVGIKVAELLWKEGIHTTLVDAAPHIFPLAAFEPVAREIEQRLERKGYHFKWNAGAKEITATGIAFADGSALEADFICMCIGTRANVELVANVDLVQGQPIQINKGIVVDKQMKTNCSDIYAAGDCCEGYNLQSGETMIIGLWANAGDQGETAGKNMVGVFSEYTGNIIHNITHFMGMDFIGLGDNRLSGEVIHYGNLSDEEGTYIQAVFAENRIQCVNILGNHHISGIVKGILMKQLVGEDMQLSSVQKAMLLKEGIPLAFIEKIGG